MHKAITVRTYSGAQSRQVSGDSRLRRRRDSAHGPAAFSAHPPMELPRREPRTWPQSVGMFSLVLMAAAAVVGAAFTSWHYWKVEERAQREEARAAQERHLQFWEQEQKRALARQQAIEQIQFVHQELQLGRRGGRADSE